MPLPIYRLRRILAVTAIALSVVVAGMYFYARSKATNVLKSIPGKIGYDIKQTANGFQFSKSDGGRTLFTVQASDIKEFKLNGNAELHNVNIILYGRDSSRFDQISGDDFVYNQKTGDVTAKGEVQIDLVANPSGLTSPDQSAPRELKNPIHLKTRDLVFNKDSGDAVTDGRVEFRTPQASGWAVGVKYAGKSNALTLASQVHIDLTGAETGVLTADHGIITSDPRQIVLDHPYLVRESGTVRSDQATFYLSSENHVERILALGNLTTHAFNAPTRSHRDPQKDSDEPPPELSGRADQGEFLFAKDEDLLRTGILTGSVHFEEAGNQPMQGDAGRVIMDFAGENQLQKVHAVDGARLAQKASTSKPDGTNAGPQDFEITAPVINFIVAQGHILRHASTDGAAKITIVQPPQTGGKSSSSQQTVVTAGTFDADFAITDGQNHLSSVHGAPAARVVNSTAGQPDRVSTSDTVDAAFLSQGGIESLTQKGNFYFSDNQLPDNRTQAWAVSARYTPADQMLILSGSPRVTNGGMETTAETIRINRATGESLAEGNVKTSYSDLKEQPGGALLASSSPIHVTANRMTSHSDPGLAVYSGKARLWQDANVIEAPSIQFDRDHRTVTALGTASQRVQTILVQREQPSASSSDVEPASQAKPEKKRAQPNSSAFAITAMKLTYVDSDRVVHCEGEVVAKGSDFTASSETADAYLVARNESSGKTAIGGPGQLDHLIAQGNVLIQQPKRRADGQKLVYTAADDKFVLTGGPPSIFDAEQGKITGVSLTFFRRDDRVLVEGEASSSVVTTTRVAQ